MRAKDLKPYTIQRGKQVITDANMFTYTDNGGGKDMTWFRCSSCSTRSCKATLIRDNMTGTVIGELPEHNHVNQRSKQKGAGDRAELKLFANLLVHTGSNLCKLFVVNIT